MTTSLHAFLGGLALVVMAGVLLSGWRTVLARMAVGHASIAAALALASLAVVDVCGGVVGSVGGGLALVVAGVAGAGAIARWRLAATTSTTAPSWTGAELTVAVLLGTLMAWCALGSWMWDERSTHLPLAGAVARGVVPLEHPVFPGQPLQYHPGYAVVVGVVRLLSGLPLDVCADLVTIVAVVVLLWTLRDLLRALAAACDVDGAIVVVVGLPLVWLGGGPLAALLADGWGAPLPGKGLLPPAWVNGATFPPLVVTNVLQHPQGLAMPVVCALLLLLAARRTAGRVAVASVAVVLLSRVQIVFCAWSGLILAMVVIVDVAVLVFRHRTQRGYWLQLAMVGAAGAASLRLGGLSVAAGNAVVLGAGYFGSDGMWALVRVPLTLGAALVALPGAVWLARRAAGPVASLLRALGLASSGAILVALVATYERSWDIVKFFGVGLFFGHVVLAVAVGALLKRGARTRVFVAAMLALSCWSGAFWLLRHGPLQGLVAPAAREFPPDPWAVSVDEACGSAVNGRSPVLSSRLSLSQVGWLVPGTPWRHSRDTVALFIDREAADRQTADRDRALQALTRTDADAAGIVVDAMAALGTRFVVVDERAEQRLQQGLRRFALRCRAPHGAVYDRRDE